MKMQAEKEQRKLKPSDHVSFDAWLCMYPYEVELARNDPNHVPLSDFSKAFPREMWVYGSFLLCKDRNLFHMADTQWGVANDFQYLG